MMRTQTLPPTRLQTLPPTRLRVVLAASACGIALASGGERPAIIAAVLGVLWVVAMHRRAPPSIGPSPEQLRRIDAARDQETEDEYVASGRGDAEYQQLLNALCALTNQDVRVLVGGGRHRSWRPLAVFTGRLRGSQSVRVEGEPEQLCFTVGNSAGNGFYLDRDRFVRGYATCQFRDDGALHVEDVDAGTVWISPYESARRP
jgi:hypothetical protein